MVLIGFLGVQRDYKNFNEKRWNSFRPSVSICMHKNLKIKKFYLLYKEAYKGLLNITVNDINEVSPETEVVPVCIDFKDDFDPMDALKGQYDFIKTLDENEEYLISLSTGTHVNHVAWFDLVKKNIINAKFVQAFALGKKDNEDLSPVDIRKGDYRIIDLNMAKYDDYHAMLMREKEEIGSFLKDGIQTLNVKYNKLIDQIESVSLKNNYPMLIQGPTGAGKSQLSERIYQLKKKKGIVTGEFTYVNCATLTKDSAQSVLFGHKKGSFTGAIGNREGLLKKANKGVLFLDEVGLLPLDVQGILLSAIETKKFYPMGSDEPVESDFCLITGTNEDLIKMSNEGQFRDDLLARIDMWNFELPGLAERVEDIEPNIDVELMKIESLTGQRTRFNLEARELFLKFAKSKEAIWKRNFRDLSSAIIRMSTLSENGIISEEEVKEELERLQRSWGNKNSVVIEVSEGEGEESTIFNTIENKLSSMIELRDLNPIERIVLHQSVKSIMESDSVTEAANNLYLDKNGDGPSNPLSKLNAYFKKVAGVNASDILKALNK